MSKQTEASRFILSPLESRSVGFYQEILREVDSYQQLGNRLIQLAEYAHAFRQFDRVKELGLILSNLPVKTYQAIGDYYLAVSFNDCGKGELDKARKLFELAADTAPPKYRAKAILSLAAVSAHQKDPDSELYYFIETLKASCDVGTSLTALRGIAVHKAREGHHDRALKELERALPLIKYAPPDVYFSHLNAVAVELGEAGRVYEARNISRIVLASPFAYAYPEWQATANDLRGLSKSFAAIKPRSYLPRKVLPMPASRYETEAVEQSRLAKVFSLQAWKKKMAKKEEKPPQDAKGMLMWMIDIYSSSDTSDYERRRIYEAAAKIIAERNNPKPDDEE